MAAYREKMADAVHQARWEDRAMKTKYQLWIVVLLVAGCAPKPDGPITAAFDGVYKGNGYSISPPGWDCPSVQPADTLTVSGGYATIADLRGWVPPSGVATLSSQIAQLQGQFQGRHFEGRLQFHERGSDRLTCGYTLKLDRVG